MAQFTIAMLVCADLKRSRDFYRDVLGLKLKTDAVPDWVDFDLGGGALLGLHPKTEVLAVRPGSLQAFRSFRVRATSRSDALR